MDYWPLILAAALVADALIGDPPGWPHLVRVMGRAIAAQERVIRRLYHSPRELLRAGAVMTLLTVAGFGLAAWGLVAVAEALWLPLALAAAFILSFECISAGQLLREARRVEAALASGDLELARGRLAMIVGRQTAELDAPGIRRAVIETVAENLGDGVVAPLFYLALLGPAGAVAYKAVNTLDSMVGYNNQRYAYLGRVAARLDDVAGYLPARLCGLLLVAAAWAARLDHQGAWRVLMRDHRAHKSPNAGWPEAAAAGALGIRLGGPSVYAGGLVEKPWLGSEGGDPNPDHVEAALRLTRMAATLCGLLAVLTAWII